MAINSGDKVATRTKEDQKEIIFTFAKNIDKFKTSDIEKLLNVKSSRARALISEMVNEDKLEAIGENRNRKYKLKIIV